MCDTQKTKLMKEEKEIKEKLKMTIKNLSLNKTEHQATIDALALSNHKTNTTLCLDRYY